MKTRLTNIMENNLMDPVLLDFHIHTSSNSDSPNENYDVLALKAGIESIAEGAPYLISITDHNFVNKSAYISAAREIENILLGVELHIRNFEQCKPYHCHIIFYVEVIDELTIDAINITLDGLYPIKTVTNDHNIPKLEDIMNAFEGYEFLLLPHGGQNHSTFDTSIPDGVQFDKTLERSIYYNHFDGFTARGTGGLERTQRYFEKLGILDFVNLVTSTDNYDPANYPDCKAGRDASNFVPTWMLASPTFKGLRLSLSESSRLEYGQKPDSWTEYIQSVSLKGDGIDIDIKLTPGLNVVIGGSSSGKSLLVDTLYHKIIGELEKSTYINTPYNISDIEIMNPSGQHPHYFNQNYIMRVCDIRDNKNTIDDISILKKVFPTDENERAKVVNALNDLSIVLKDLVQSVTELELLQESLKRIPFLHRLIVTEVVHDNPLKKLLPSDQEIESINYESASYERHIKTLDEIDQLLVKNPFVNHDTDLIEKIKAELLIASKGNNLEGIIRGSITVQKNRIDAQQAKDNLQVKSCTTDFQTLLDSLKKYLKYNKRFNNSLNTIASFSISTTSKKIESMGHSLYINNEFELTKDVFLKVINNALKAEYNIELFDEITPESLFKSRFKLRDPKLDTYEKFEIFINNEFSGMNKKTYKITTNDGRDFDKLSAGWKTSVILDLILGWDSDRAPLIIDQPEDNLATSYINSGLLSAIKKCKTKKQIILVSHNATIPMLGDAQNIIMCSNDNNNITIYSNPLEGNIGGKDVVDLIAEVTDGGKPSIKKRVKKYNLKDFREEV